VTAAPARIGILGGTFDPVHLGHLIIATELRHALRLDRVLFVPAGQPPHKPEQEITAQPHRLAMLRLALAGNHDFSLSTDDLDRSGPSYTSDMLSRLKDELKPASLFFLMGQDSLRDLPNWHEPGIIATLAELGVALRPGVVADIEQVTRLVPEARGRIHLVPVPMIGISSSAIRERVARGAPIAYQVPGAVEHYIRDHGLYRADPSADPPA